MPLSLRFSSLWVKPTRLLLWSLLLTIWSVLYLLACASPSVLDDADATHAQAAAAMLRTGDWVTLHVDGIRYLEKPPLPYWLTACSLRLFGINSFAVHLPLALTVLGLAVLAWFWGERLSSRSGQGAGLGFFAALFVLTSAGVFLFTRIFIPDALLSLLLAYTLYACLRALEQERSNTAWALSAWAAMAAAVLTKGLVAPVFVLAALLPYLYLSGELRLWRRLHPASGLVVFFALAAPWHILAGVRNRGGAQGHGFFWFYFINEHVLRFLGRRSPPDYNKLPTALYWSSHLVWLFPWSFFAPLAVLLLWRHRSKLFPLVGSRPPLSFAGRSLLLLSLFSAFVLLFFSISTNQEYYTFPVYLPLLLITAYALQRYGSASQDSTARRWILAGQITLTLLCVAGACALLSGLWLSRRLPAAPDVGDLLVSRDVAGYTLSMAHLFDLTTAAFSGLRLPASLACVGLFLGSLASLAFCLRRRQGAAIMALAGMSTVFLIAAHVAFVRFGPMLSSRAFAEQIQHLEATHQVSSSSEVMLYGDQAFGSSIPFYLGHQVELVDGRSTSMLFGSTFPDAPPIFLTHGQLAASWGQGERKLLFVPQEQRTDVDQLLGSRAILLYQHADKALFTDRPLATPSTIARLYR